MQVMKPTSSRRCRSWGSSAVRVEVDEAGTVIAKSVSFLRARHATGGHRPPVGSGSLLDTERGNTDGREMDYFPGVRGLSMSGDRERFGDGDRPALDVRRQVLAVDQLHHQGADGGRLDWP